MIPRRRCWRLPLWALLLGWVVGGCGASTAGTAPEDVLRAHQRACIAKGQLLIERQKAANWGCIYIQSYLRAFADTDEDCKTYMQDAGLQICSDAGVPVQNEGGTDGVAQ